MINLARQIDLLERCAQECTLISVLAADQSVRSNNRELAADYRMIIDGLKYFEMPLAA